jgi:membrane-bound ClpP family serine protease
MLFWGLGLLAAALLLVIIEVFVPSGGLIAFVAAGSAIAGVYCLFRVSPMWGVIGILCVLILGPLTFSFALRVWPSTPIGRKMMGEKSPEQLEAERKAETQERERLASLIGAEGVVLTDLRPVGVVQIGSDRFDALAESAFIRAGTRVRVSVVQSNQIKVRAIT